MKTILTPQEEQDYLTKAQAAGFSPEVARQHLAKRGITVQRGTPVGQYAKEFATGGLNLVKNLAAPPIKLAGALALKGFQGVDALASYAAGQSPQPLDPQRQQMMDQMVQAGLNPRNIRDSLLTLSPFGGAKFASLAIPAAVSEFGLAKSEGKPTGEAVADAAKIGISTRLLGMAGGPKTMAAIGGGLQAANEYMSGQNPLSPEGLGGITAAAGLGYLGGKANERGYDVGMSKKAPIEPGAPSKNMIGSEAQSLVSQFSGLRSESQAAAFDPQTRAMTEGMLKGTTEPMTAVSRIHETLKQLADDVSDTGQEYNFVRQSKQFEPIPKDTFQTTLEKYGMRFVPEGKAEKSPILGNMIQKGHIEIDPTGPATRMSPHAIDQVEAFMKMTGGVTAVTPEVFKQAKAALREAGDFYDPSIPGGGGAIKGLAGEMLSTLDRVRDNATSPDFQAYKLLDEKYAPKIRQLDELRGFFEPDPVTGKMRIKDTARGKILNALKGNKTNLINDLERLSPGITREIRAYETYQNIIAENKPGQYVRAAAKGAGAGYVLGGTMGGVAGGIAAIFASEPRVVFSLLSKIAQTKEMLGIKPDQILFKVERGMPLNKAETAAVRAAAQEANTPATSQTPGSKESTSPNTLPEPKAPVHGLKESRLIELKGGKKGTPGIDYPAKPNEAAGNFSQPQQAVMADSKITNGSVNGTKTLPKGKTLYHSTDKVFDEFDTTKSADGSIWFTDNKVDITDPKRGVGASGKGVVMERIVPDNLKLATPEMLDSKFVDQLINEGYDGVYYPGDKSTGNFYQIFDPKKLQKPK